MGCPTFVTPQIVFESTLSPTQQASASVSVPAGATIAFCRLAGKAGAIDANTGVSARDSGYSQYYSTVWCQVPNLWNEVTAMFPISNGTIYFQNFGTVNAIDTLVVLLAYA